MVGHPLDPSLVKNEVVYLEICHVQQMWHVHNSDKHVMRQAVYTS